MTRLRSDNNAGICPEALEGLLRANDGSHVVGYGNDVFTTEAVDAFREVFASDDIAVFFVATGTAANTLALAALSEPWQRVLCYEHCHIIEDESTAPERIARCRITGITPTRFVSRITPDDFLRHARTVRGDVHEPQPGVLTISNPTEFGEVYSPSEVAELCAAAHQHGFRLHMDGARFANAVAALGCPPRELTLDAGVDALSFGGAKNGLALGEAVVFFRQGDGSAFERAAGTFEFHRKATGHLLSKHRFVAAPFAASLHRGAWLRHASHANAMATRLAQGFEERGLRLHCPAQSNGVFVHLPPEVRAALERGGHGFYMFGEPARFMCSWNTTPDDIEAVLRDIPDLGSAADPC